MTPLFRRLFAISFFIILAVNLAGPVTLSIVQSPSQPPPLAWIALQVAMATVGIGGVFLVLQRTLLRDLVRLEDTSKALAEGNFDARSGLVDGPVGALGRQLDAMADTVQSTLAGQKSMLAAVSHEIRTPAARMRFQLEALECSPPSEHPTWIGRLDKEIGNIDALLTQLLRLQRLEASESDEPTVDSLPFVRARIEELRPLSEINLTLQGDAGFAFPASDLTRIVENLITNAQRHASSRVEVHISPTELSVHDDGPGIPASECEAVFEPFASLNIARTGELGGVGLGLPIARESARRNGWDLTAKRSPLGGAWFRLGAPE